MTNIIKTAISILKKAEAYAKENSIAMSDLLATSLCEDMMPLQIQFAIVAVTSQKGLERIAGAPSTTDNGKREFNLKEMYELLEGALKAVESTEKSNMVEESATVPCSWYGKALTARATDYIQGYTLPTLYFHLSMAYAILRMKGIPLGKLDYMVEVMKDITPVAA